MYCMTFAKEEKQGNMTASQGLTSIDWQIDPKEAELQQRHLTVEEVLRAEGEKVPEKPEAEAGQQGI
jgi:hypothetical protein